MAEQGRQDELRHLNFRGAKPMRLRRQARVSATAVSPMEAVAPVASDERAESAVDPFIVWLFGRAELDPMLYRASPLRRRLPACLRALKADSTEHARELVEQRPELLAVAMDSLLLGVTEFFRDQPVFDSLRTLLPSLAEQHRPVRIWSVSCSVGCELYSAGILLSELGLLHDCQLLGTDCRAEALSHAQRGSYSEAYLRRLGLPLRGRYFESAGSEYRVREPLLSQSRWRRQNVLESSEKADNSGVWDAILWRNTAIYLRSAAARSVWNRLASSLRPGGLLVTGKAERPECRLPLSRLAGCIYQRPAD